MDPALSIVKVSTASSSAYDTRPEGAAGQCYKQEATYSQMRGGWFEERIETSNGKLSIHGAQERFRDLPCPAHVKTKPRTKPDANPKSSEPEASNTAAGAEPS